MRLTPTGRGRGRGVALRLRLQHTFMPAGDASLTTAQVNQKNPLTAITVSTAISETSAQNIPLKGRTVCGNPAEFRPQRLFAFELRRCGYSHTRSSTLPARDRGAGARQDRQDAA